MSVWNKPPSKITLRRWICGERIVNTTPSDIVKIYKANLITADEARQLLNIHGSAYDHVNREVSDE